MLSIAPIPEVPIPPLGVWPDFELFKAAKLKSSGDTDSFDVRLLNLHNGRTPTRIANSKGAHMSRNTAGSNSRSPSSVPGSMSFEVIQG